MQQHGASAASRLSKQQPTWLAFASKATRCALGLLQAELCAAEGRFLIAGMAPRTSAAIGLPEILS